MLAVRPDLVNMADAVDEKDYETFFEYRMDQYSKSGIVGRETTKAKQEFGEKIFAMVVDNLVSMVEDAERKFLKETKRKRTEFLGSFKLNNINCTS